ncbi:MAG: fumarylacetoacetate hydrolase family protein [Burkholderiaceae bacterium]
MPVIQVGGRHWLLKDVADAQLLQKTPRGLIDLFADWDRSFDALASIAQRVDRLAKAVDDGGASLRFLTPLQYPNKVMLTGTNYYDHLRAVGRTDFNKSDNYPAFFMKPPSTALVGPGDIRYPSESKQFDWEIELAAIFGRRTRRVPVERALDYVAAYAVGLDMSARDMQRNARHFAKMDLCLGKAFDDSCPLGPYVVPAQFVGDPQKLSLKLWLNDRIEQDSSTGHMIWSTAEQIAEISKFITLEPGDVLLTGTPAGTGIEQNRYLSIGDRIDAEIADFGRLSVRVVAE